MRLGDIVEKRFTGNDFFSDKKSTWARSISKCFYVRKQRNSLAPERFPNNFLISFHNARTFLQQLVKYVYWTKILCSSWGRSGESSVFYLGK